MPASGSPPRPFAYKFDYTASGTRRSIEDSLQRLGVSRIDIVFIHDLSPDTGDLGRPWTEAFNEAADDHKKLSDLVEDMYLDPLLKAVPKRGLVKLGAKLLGTTPRALTADLKRGAVENEPRRDHLSLAREAVESFGEGGLIFAQGEFWSWQVSGVWALPDEQDVRKAAIGAIEGCEAVTDGL